MFLLDIGGLCSDPGIANIIAIIKKFVNMLWIVGPILAIIAAFINGFKLMSNPDEKKFKGLFKNSIMALLFLFFIPLLVNVVMGALGEDFEVSACWNASGNVSVGGQGGYIDPGTGDKSGSMLTDPDKYETGTPPSTGSSDSSSSTGSSYSDAGVSNNTYTSSKNRIRYNLYNQADSRWANYKFSSGETIAANGCMITSDAVVLSAADPSITPLTVFNSSSRHAHPRNGINSLSNGYWSCKSGSANSSSITNALNNGQVVVIKVYGRKKGGSSSFTSSQHYMALIDINSSSIFVGNAYSSSGHGKSGWFSTSSVLTSVQTADYCTPTAALLAKY